jgi:hypothetical protein
MKFWSVTTPPARRAAGGLATLGLIMLAATPAAHVLAGDAPKPPVAATSKPDAQPATHQARPATPSLPAKAKAKPANAVSGTAECVRTGQRVIAALARDDSGAANQFHTFYMAFKCSPQHLAHAFGCLVNLQAAHPGLSNPSPEQVTECWEEPSEMPKVQPPPAADGSGEKH